MYNIDFKKPIHIHFIGIGGISMSGLAKILKHRGFTISGSDTSKSSLTKELEDIGCKISYMQSAENITDDIDLVVYTAAINPDNPEYRQALNKDMDMLSRADLLGQIMKNFNQAINVAGTHGKTTTTSMISEILIEAQLDPTISVGGILESIGGNLRLGGSDIFLTEACEYTNSFLSFYPTIDVILNVEEDHLDFFKDINDIRHSFKLFTERLPQTGILIINSDIDNIEYFYNDTCVKVITFGTNPYTSTFSLKDIVCDKLGNYSYTLLVNNEAAGKISLRVPGLHNVTNSLAAAALGYELSIPFEVISKGLYNFSGTKRRFEYKGTFNGVTVIDDYAHHPSEITATLTSAQKYPHRDIWCVFQPHTYTRTKAFLTDFASSLSLADHVVLAPIYAARETNTLGISSQNLADELVKLGTDVVYLPDFESIEKFLQKKCIQDDLLITMGAGNVVNIGENLIL
ncbi:MAG: UDP-N-acetylmuramate--L-alanine ligase [Lachnospira sp.]|nr:UDP-N-acetylmuramate--L-alanine ligase [Lachnospira sp.]